MALDHAGAAAFVRRFAAVQDHEVTPLLHSFASLFFILASYFLLMPLREEAGISLGTHMLPKLFSASLVAALLFAPLASAFLSRPHVPRERSLRQFYVFLASSLVAFYGLYHVAALQGEWDRRLWTPVGPPVLPGTTLSLEQLGARATAALLPLPAPRHSSISHGDAHLGTMQRLVRASFYVWLSVLNLASISALWARCADVFSAEAASRLFGLISAGGTIGQLVGSLISVAVARNLGLTSEGPVYIVVLLSAVLMFAAAWFAARVRRPGAASFLPPPPPGLLSSSKVAAAAAAPGPRAVVLEGSAPLITPTLRVQMQRVSEGFTLVLASPYLLMVCGYLMLTYVVGSLMYFQRSLVVATLVRDARSRTAFFASVYSASAFIICGLQMFATGHMLRVCGIPLVLALFPAACAVGILAIWHTPTTSTVAAVEVLRKVLAYSVIRPAREVLFTVVSREEKYKAKLCIDTVVQRLGDVGAALVFEILDVQLSLGLAGVAAAGALMCLVWTVVSVRLGAQQQALASQAGLSAGASAV